VRDDPTELLADIADNQTVELPVVGARWPSPSGSRSGSTPRSIPSSSIQFRAGTTLLRFPSGPGDPVRGAAWRPIDVAPGSPSSSVCATATSLRISSLRGLSGSAWTVSLERALQ
jgi:hypothetical protein